MGTAETSENLYGKRLLEVSFFNPKVEGTLISLVPLACEQGGL